VRFPVTAALACALALTACTTTTYRPFVTSGDAIFEGKGGIAYAQDGMEIWDFGDPPRRYKVLGIVDDERPGGVGPMNRLFGDVVSKAREVGGQALIQVRNQSQIVGYQRSDSAYAVPSANPASAAGTATSIPVRKNKAQFLVIQYVQ